MPSLGKCEICLPSGRMLAERLFGYLLLQHMPSPPTYSLLRRLDVGSLGFPSLNLSFCLESSMPPAPKNKSRRWRRGEKGIITEHGTALSPDRRLLHCGLPGYWNGLPFRSPRDLPNPGIEPGLLHCRQILYQLSYKGSPASFMVTPHSLLEDSYELALG